MTPELITFNHLRWYSSSTALGTRTCYWKSTWRGTVSFLAITLARVIQLSTGAANGDVDGWTWETAWVTGQRGEIVNGNQ